MNDQNQKSNVLSNILSDLGATLSDFINVPPDSDAAPVGSILNTIINDAQTKLIDLSQIGLPEIAGEILNGVKNAIPEIAATTGSADKLHEIERYLAEVYGGLSNNSNQKTWRAINALLSWWASSLPNLSLPYTTDSLKTLVPGLQVPVDYSDTLLSPSGKNSGPTSQPSKKKTDSTNQQPASNPKSVLKYWLIRLNYRSWDKNFKDGESVINYTVYKNWKEQIERPGHRLFGKLQVGDLVIGYGYGDAEGIMCELRVSAGKHLAPDPAHGEVVTLDLVQRVKPIIPLAAFDGKYGFTNEFRSVNGKRLFELNKAVYTDLLKPLQKAARGALVGLTNDHIDGALQPDALRFTVDVASIAAVIAYKKVIPPIAVALLGNWGSGKSFFMQMLRENIKDLSKESELFYCRSVAHIEFNSWHYSDANLWASITAKLFEGLDDFVAMKDTMGTPASLDTLLNRLDSTMALKAEQQKALDIAHATAADMKQQKEKLNRQIEAARNTLDGLSFPDMLRSMLRQPELTSELKTIAESTKIPGLKNASDIETAKNRLEDDGKRVKDFFVMIYAVKNYSFWVVIGIAALVVYGLVILFNGNSNWLKDPAHLALGGIFTLISPLFSRFKKISARFKKADSWISQRYQEMQTTAAAQYNMQKQAMQNQISQSQIQTAALEKSLSEAKASEEELRKEINDQVTGKKLGEFIKGRSTDDRYTGSLGMISWIRRDFEQLDKYLAEMREASMALAPEKKIPNNLGIANTDLKRLEIDRIILYIDDLDRCPGPVVTKVLEAIHLLLAFPLFVVVVGVDPRWMHGALDTTYTGLLGTAENGLAATSYDYLEKIFQVPFAIAPADENGRKQLIRNQIMVETLNDDNSELSDDQATAGNNDAEAAAVSKNAPGVTIESKKTNIATGSGAGDKRLATGAGVAGPDLKQELLPKIEPLRLRLTTEELNFMQALSFLIGDSPRTIKRYINIYRIIRAHGSFLFEGDREQDDYFAAMLLAGILTGQNTEAAFFFQAVAAAPETINKKEHKGVVHMFDDFLDGYMKNNQGAKPVALQHLHRVMRGDPLLKQLKTISIKVFKANLELISRFSFRPLLPGGAIGLVMGENK